MTLTVEHHRLLKTALRGNSAPTRLSAEHRSAIRQICADLVPTGEPEKLLIVFKAALNQAANAEHIPIGVERSAMIARLVSVFIEELYAAGVGDRVAPARHDGDGRATAVRLILENESSGALP